MASIAIARLISVGLIGLYIYTEPAGSTTNPTASSRSRERYETSSGLGFSEVIGDRREYRIILSILRYTPLSPFSSPL